MRNLFKVPPDTETKLWITDAADDYREVKKEGTVQAQSLLKDQVIQNYSAICFVLVTVVGEVLLFDSWLCSNRNYKEKFYV